LYVLIVVDFLDFLFFFFFSSRRRHTSFSRDWSSDVCSSDLRVVPGVRALLRDVAETLERHDLPVGLQFFEEGAQGGGHHSAADEHDIYGFAHDLPPYSRRLSALRPRRARRIALLARVSRAQDAIRPAVRRAPRAALRSGSC